MVVLVLILVVLAAVGVIAIRNKAEAELPAADAKVEAVLAEFIVGIPPVPSVGSVPPKV